MSSLGSPNSFFLAGKKAYEVDRSLRFNDGDSANLNRTPSSAGNQKTWTLSVWIKRTTIDANQRIFTAYDGSNTNAECGVQFQSDGKIQIWNNNTSSNTDTNLKTDRLFRDPSAWYHIVVATDMTQGTAANRVNFYVNGVQETSFSTESYGTQNVSWWFNYTSLQTIGIRHTTGERPFDGYMAEFNFVDGQQYDPSYFGATDVITGQWNPKKYVGSYGTNGYYLNFSDNSGTTATTLGKDSSGNGNNFTPNNFSVAAGAGNDSVQDTPTNNWSTLNPLHWNVLKGAGGTANGADFTQGNLRFVGPSSVTSPYNRQTASTIAVSSGAWYFEATIESMNNAVEIGFSQVDAIDSNGYYTGTWGFNPYDQRKLIAGTETSYGAQASANDVLGFAFDLDNNTMELFINNSSQGQVTSLGISGKTVIVSVKLAFSNIKYTFNFGQQGFAYTPPTGYKALNSANLPDPTILLPNKHFGTLLYSSGSSNGTFTFTDSDAVDFFPDWTWLKCRSAGEGHYLFDAVRGNVDITDKFLKSNDTGTETGSGVDGTTVSSIQNGIKIVETSIGSGEIYFTNRDYVTWNWNAGDTDGKTYTVTVVDDSGNKYRFDGFGTSAVTLDLAEGGTYIFNYPSAHPLKFSTTSDGTHGGGSEYTTGVTHNSSTQVTIVVAASAPQLFYYCSIHSGMGGAVNTNTTLGSSNFDGTTQSTAKVNATAGFSIVTYKGNGSSGNTVGHGLGVAPNLLLVKNRDYADVWLVGSDQLGFTKQIYLNSSDASATSAEGWNNTAPTSSVFTLGNGNATNRNTDDHIAYVFSEVAGYSKFGSYTGNGNADGTFVFTGFRPAWIMVKNTTGGNDWTIMDNKRDVDNPTALQLFADLSNADYSATGVDILANGFKCRSTASEANGSGATYIYLAFAESPFRNARAR